METLFSILIGVSVTAFFVRRHLRTLPPEKPKARPARAKR
jgi:hypothetical protein